MCMYIYIYISCIHVTLYIIHKSIIYIICIIAIVMYLWSAGPP